MVIPPAPRLNSGVNINKRMKNRPLCVSPRRRNETHQIWHMLNRAVQPATNPYCVLISTNISRRCLVVHRLVRHGDDAVGQGA